MLKENSRCVWELVLGSCHVTRRSFSSPHVARGGLYVKLAATASATGPMDSNRRPPLYLDEPLAERLLWGLTLGLDVPDGAEMMEVDAPGREVHDDGDGDLMMEEAPPTPSLSAPFFSAPSLSAPSFLGAWLGGSAAGSLGRERQPNGNPPEVEVTGNPPEVEVTGNPPEVEVTGNPPEVEVTGNSRRLAVRRRTQAYDSDSDGEPHAPWLPATILYQMHHHHYYTDAAAARAGAAGGAAAAPYLAQYVQLALNTLAALYACYIVYSAVGAINADVQRRHALALHAVRVEIALCRRRFRDNRCHPDTIVPALEAMCGVWERCMARAPEDVAMRSSLAAEVLGLMVQLLFAPMGWKALVWVAVFVASVAVLNVSLGSLRARLGRPPEALIGGTPLGAQPPAVLKTGTEPLISHQKIGN